MRFKGSLKKERGSQILQQGALSKIDVEYGLDDMLKFRDNVFVLFYVSWCPFSQRFLPIFEKFAQGKAQSCLRVKTGDKASLRESARVKADVVDRCADCQESWCNHSWNNRDCW